LDFFRYLKPLKKQQKASVRAQIRRKFRVAVRKFMKNKNRLPNALDALQDIKRERRRKQREILHLQRINTIKYLQEKSPLIQPSQDFNSGGVNMFINQTINNQYNIQNLNYQPQMNQIQGFQPVTDENLGNKEQEELEMLRKMDEETRKEKAKTNENLNKLLNLIEVHNGTLEQIESKFKKEFSDIKENLRKIKAHQHEEAERVAFEKANFETAEYEKWDQSKKKIPLSDESESEDEKVERKMMKKLPEQHYLKEDDPIHTKDYADSIEQDDIGLSTFPPNSKPNKNQLNSSKKGTKKMEAKNSNLHGNLKTLG